MTEARSQFATLRRELAKYYRDYGGNYVVIRSPFLHASILLSVLSFASWSSVQWADLSLSTLPNLLGFSLGTYALLFSLMSGRMKQALKALRNRRGIRYLDEINSTFFHFILFQVVAILWAYVAKQTFVYSICEALGLPSAVWNPALEIGLTFSSFVGIALFSYSILLTVASSLVIFRLARLVDPNPN